ncbi:21 kDa protein [Hibiscus syriacus]|uniref:21 kDa protein n=1 Tax=Hibiscus syriacus TaxID=106335 RepID=A0A6A2WS52_HIBSY|nr:21 kDa protein [Hibiscus syriacus]
MPPTPGLKPKEEAALHDCVEEISDSVDEFRRSISEMKDSQGISFAFRMSDVETWVSAALTDDDTCMDGFYENDMDGDVKATVKTAIEKVAQLTSISLAFVNQYAGSK